MAKPWSGTSETRDGRGRLDNLDYADHAVVFVAGQVTDKGVIAGFGESERSLPTGEGGYGDLRRYFGVEGLGTGAVPFVNVRATNDPFVLDRVIVSQGEGDRDALRNGDHARLELRVAYANITVRSRCATAAGSDEEHERRCRQQ